MLRCEVLQNKIKCKMIASAEQQYFGTNACVTVVGVAVVLVWRWAIVCCLVYSNCVDSNCVKVSALFVAVVGALLVTACLVVFLSL